MYFVLENLKSSIFALEVSANGVEVVVSVVVVSKLILIGKIGQYLWIEGKVCWKSFFRTPVLLSRKVLEWHAMMVLGQFRQGYKLKYKIKYKIHFGSNFIFSIFPSKFTDGILTSKSFCPKMISNVLTTDTFFPLLLQKPKLYLRTIPWQVDHYLSMSFALHYSINVVSWWWLLITSDCITTITCLYWYDLILPFPLHYKTTIEKRKTTPKNYTRHIYQNTVHFLQRFHQKWLRTYFFRQSKVSLGLPYLVITILEVIQQK